MAYENFWSQASSNLSATGGADGRVSVTSTLGFYVRQKVTLSSGSSNTTGMVKEVISSTVLRVGPDDGNTPGTAYDLSSYNPSGSLFAAFQPIIYGRGTDVLKNTYEVEPTKAIRVITVDPVGNYIDPSGASTPISVTVTGLSVTVSNASLTVANAVSAASFQYIKVVAATLTVSLTSSATAFPAGTISAAARIFSVLSSLDSAVGIALNGTQIAELNQGESFGYDLATNGRVINASTTIGLWNISTTSVTGSIRFQIVS